MAKWDKVTEVKENGYYIGWYRRHPMIHMRKDGPCAKDSLVQISSTRDGAFTIEGYTYAHIFPFTPGQKGITLLKEFRYAKGLKEAKNKAAELKSYLAKRFDPVTRDPALG